MLLYIFSCQSQKSKQQHANSYCSLRSLCLSSTISEKHGRGIVCLKDCNYFVFWFSLVCFWANATILKLATLWKFASVISFSGGWPSTGIMNGSVFFTVFGILVATRARFPCKFSHFVHYGHFQRFNQFAMHHVQVKSVYNRRVLYDVGQMQAQFSLN